MPTAFITWLIASAAKAAVHSASATLDIHLLRQCCGTRSVLSSHRVTERKGMKRAPSTP